MANSMTTSQMTNGQIDRACEILRAKLTKHAADFSYEAVQQVFGQSELGTEWLETFRKRVEVVSGMIKRTVKVDRSRDPQAVLDDTGRRQYTDTKIVNSIPRGDGEEKDVFFFKLGRLVSDDDLAKEYELRGLVPDPYAQAQVNIDDPSFADEHPNGSHWLSDAKWCSIAFSRWGGAKRGVYVSRRGNAWHDDWWFAGVRK